MSDPIGRRSERGGIHPERLRAAVFPTRDDGNIALRPGVWED